jgi:hypothetical protein
MVTPERRFEDFPGSVFDIDGRLIRLGSRVTWRAGSDMRSGYVTGWTRAGLEIIVDVPVPDDDGTQAGDDGSSREDRAPTQMVVVPAGGLRRDDDPERQIPAPRGVRVALLAPRTALVVAPSRADLVPTGRESVLGLVLRDGALAEVVDVLVVVAPAEDEALADETIAAIRDLDIVRFADDPRGDDGLGRVIFDVVRVAVPRPADAIDSALHAVRPVLAALPADVARIVVWGGVASVVRAEGLVYGAMATRADVQRLDVHREAMGRLAVREVDLGRVVGAPDAVLVARTEGPPADSTATRVETPVETRLRSTT